MKHHYIFRQDRIGAMLVCVLLLTAWNGWACEITDGPDGPGSIPRVDNGYVKTIARGTTHIYVGGSFTTVANGVVRKGLAAFDAVTGALDLNWDPGLDDSSGIDVPAIAVDNGKVYVVGRFETVRNGTFLRNNAVAFSEADGSSPAVVDPAWNPNLDNVAEALAVTESHVYIGGFFETVNASVSRNCLAAFAKANGTSPATVDPSWNPNLDYVTYGVEDPFVTTLVVHESLLYVGGNFDRIQGASGQIVRTNLAAVELAGGGRTGVADAAWNPGVELFGTVETLAIANNRVYVGGSFESVLGGTQTRHKLAAFNLADGTSAAQVDPWNPMIGSTVHALAVNGGRVFVGGSFTSVLNGTVTRTCIAAFNEADGASAAMVDPWNPIGALYWNYYVFALTPAGECGIYLGGNFIYIGGKYRYRIAGYGTDWEPGPEIRLLLPLDSATAYGPNTAIDVTFSKNVLGVDAGDLVLSGPAALGATVGPPSLMQQTASGIITNFREMWRFPVLGLSEGALTVTLAPNPGDIVDSYGRSLSQANNTWQYTVVHSAAAVPFQDSFESGVFDPWWDRRGTTIYFRNQLLSTYAPCHETRHLVMDNTLTNTYSRNEVTLTVDLEGLIDVFLAFNAKVPDSWSPNPPAVPFLNGSDFDGVAISADNLHWYQVQSLRIGDGIGPNCQEFEVDLDAAIAAHGLNYNSNFKIRFNHYDFWSYGMNGGMAIDQVRVTVLETDPEVVNVTSTHSDGVYPQGEVIPIQVVFSQPVSVAGMPFLTLETGAIDRNALFTNGSGTTTLHFEYTVQSGDASPDLEYTDSSALQLNGGAITSVATGNPALLALPPPGAPGSLSHNKDIAIDTTAPSVGSVTVTGLLAATLSYNQAMGAGVTTPGNYALSGTAMGTLTEHPDSVIDLGGNQYRLVWNDGEMRQGGDFTITVTAVSDAIGNPIGANNSATHAGGGLGIAPTVDAFEVTGLLGALVTFDEAMTASALSPAAYTVSGTGLGTLTTEPDSVTAVDDRRYALSWTTGEMTIGGDLTVTVADVTDLAGNPITAGNTATDAGGGQGVRPELLTVEVLDITDMRLTFSEPLLSASLFVDNFAVSGTGRGSLPLRPSLVFDEGNGQVRLRFGSGEMKTGGNITITVENVRDLAGNAVQEHNQATHTGGGIGIPPELHDIEVDTHRTVFIQFNELMGGGCETATNYTVSGSGRGTLASHPDSVQPQGFEVYKLVWNNGEMKQDGDITITASHVVDLVGNEIEDSDGITDFGGGIGIPPELQHIEVISPRSVHLQFNESMGFGADVPANYSVSGTGRGALSPQPDSVTLLSDALYGLDWNTGEMFIGGDITVTATNAEDLAGNPVNDVITAPGAGRGAPPLAAIEINNGASITTEQLVTLRFTQADGTGSDVVDARFRNDNADWNAWQPFADTLPWTLSAGDAWKTVYAEIRDAAGNVVEIPATATVILDATPLVAAAVGDTHVVKATGDSHAFTVTITAGLFGIPVFEWTHTPAIKTTDRAMIKEDSGSVLLLENIEPQDAGTYACQVTDETESAEPVVFTLGVYDSVPASQVLLLILAVIAVSAAFSWRNKPGSHGVG